VNADYLGQTKAELPQLAIARPLRRAAARARCELKAITKTRAFDRLGGRFCPRSIYRRRDDGEKRRAAARRRDRAAKLYALALTES